MSFGFHIHKCSSGARRLFQPSYRVFGTLKYIGLCSVLFLQPGFGVVALEAVDEDTEAVVTVSPVWDKESVGTFRTDTCRNNMPPEVEEDP
jgi:hypothetical protein